MKGTIRKIFFYLAIIGWCLSMIVHILSVCNVSLDGEYPYTWALHIGIFVVWVPAIISMSKNKVFEEFKESGNIMMSPTVYFKTIFGGVPVWMTVIVAACFIYAFLNFYYAFGFIDTGRVVINDEANTTRGFSGHWLALYSIAAAILYSYEKKEKSDSEYNKEYK